MGFLALLGRPIQGGHLIPGIIGRIGSGVTFPVVTPGGVTNNTLLEIAKGNVAGHSVFFMAGLNANVTTTEASIWPEGGIYIPPVSATIMTVSSTDSNDTALGTGLRTVDISGLDTNYNIISEVVTLNGLTSVSTINSYLRVRKMTGRTAGTTDINDGKIYIGTGLVTAGIPANIFNLIPIDKGISKTAFYTVPFGKSAYIITSVKTVDAGKEVETEISVKPFGGSIIKRSSIFASGVNTIPFEGLLRFKERTDIDLRAKTTSQTAAIDVVLSLLEIDD